MSEEENVPRTRLNEVIAERDTARAKITTLESLVADNQKKLDSYKALSEQAAGYQAEISKLKETIASKEKGWDMEKSMLATGLKDEDTRELARMKFEKNGGDKSFEDWFKEEAEKPYIKNSIITPAANETDAEGKGKGDEGDGEDKGNDGLTSGTDADKLNMDKGNPKTGGAHGLDFSDPMVIKNLSDEDYDKYETEIIAAL